MTIIAMFPSIQYHTQYVLRPNRPLPWKKNRWITLISVRVLLCSILRMSRKRRGIGKQVRSISSVIPKYNPYNAYLSNDEVISNTWQYYHDHLSTFKSVKRIFTKCCGMNVNLNICQLIYIYCTK